MFTLLFFMSKSLNLSTTTFLKKLAGLCRCVVCFCQSTILLPCLIPLKEVAIFYIPFFNCFRILSNMASLGPQCYLRRKSHSPIHYCRLLRYAIVAETNYIDLLMKHTVATWSVCGYLANEIPLYS